MPGKLVGGTVAAALMVAGLVAPAAAATNDPHFAKQWGLAKIGAEQAWATSDGTGTIIAIVDTGVDLGHPDLSSKIIDDPGADFVDPDGICGEGTCTHNGAQDENGHGTHVAGIAAAITGNGVGVAGTAPGARILPVRVLDANAQGSTDQLAAGIRYAADRGADVINLSLSYDLPGHLSKLTGALQPVYSAIGYAHSRGAVVVIAAGNQSAPLCGEPAAAPGVLCVGATDRQDLRSYFSNGDATLMRSYLVAPGGDGLSCAGEIFSTYLRGAATLCSSDGGYEGDSGTSMAAPFVSGVAALLKAKGLSNTAIVGCILQTADDLGIPGRDPVFGHGRLNAAAAVADC